jgi:hypothetical protein
MIGKEARVRAQRALADLRFLRSLDAVRRRDRTAPLFIHEDLFHVDMAIESLRRALKS